MADFSRIRTVKRAAESFLLALPGVHSVGIGAKSVAGQSTGEPAILIFVVRKKATADLRPEEIIPPVIDGVKTDVIEVPMPTLAFGDNPDPESHTPVRGGTALQTGGSQAGTGTLGCIAHTDEPTSRIVALTCHHVVQSVGTRPSALQVTVAADQRHITFANANTPGSFVVTNLAVIRSNGNRQAFEIYVRTGTMTLAQVAAAVANRINALADPDFNASAAGAVVTITWLNGVIILLDCSVYGRVESDPAADLRVTVANNVATFSGATSGEFYGVFATVYIGGPMTITRGTFEPVAKGQSLASVATAVAAWIGALNVAGLSATAAGAQVTVAGTDAMELYVMSDARVGHPSNDFTSECCCCVNRIGRVVTAELEIDTSMVQLDPELEYLAEQHELGIVTGSHTVTDDEALVGYPVKKRGYRTRESHGRVTSIDHAGFISLQAGATGRAGYRRYANVMRVEGLPAPDPSAGIFALQGDSGSAVVNAAGEVVGILFGSTIPAGSPSLVTPIQQVLTRLNIGISTATALNQVKKVPKPAGAQAARVRGAPSGKTWERVQKVESEIAATSEGKAYVDMVKRNALEMQMLVTRKRPVIVAWQRNGGPALVRAVLDSLGVADQQFPTALGDKPLDDCLSAIAKAVRPHASPGLASDLDAFLPLLSGMGGHTYADLVRRLQGSGAAADRADDRSAG